MAAQPGAGRLGLLFPIVSVIMYGYVFGSVMTVAGGGDYREFLMPGLFVMTIAFGFAEVATAITTDAGRGVTDRFRSMPMSPPAVVVGRSMADMVNGVLALTLLVLCGLAVGWSWHEGLAGALAVRAAAVAALRAHLGRHLARAGGQDP